VSAARAAREAAMGEDHPALARTLTIEARVRMAQGDDAGAAQLFARAASIKARTNARAAGDAIAVAPGIDLLRGRFVLTEQPDGNTTILRAPQGLVVVDTGRHAAHTQRIVDFAAAAGQPVTAVVNTHWHLDHVGGDVMLRRLFPACTCTPAPRSKARGRDSWPSTVSTSWARWPRRPVTPRRRSRCGRSWP
jgi:glyoxylase-like metal-dependent hydrolase (beta-lactamase superfamily II)